MNKLLTIGLAAAALAGGIAATSGAAQADERGQGGYHQSDRSDRDHGRGDRDRGRGDHERGDRGRDGYRYGGCQSYRTWNPHWGRYTTVTRCY